MRRSFASWLATRCAIEIELAPGVATPRSFGDPPREHLATRRAGGLFDFSFMQSAEIHGPRALDCVEALQTRRVAALSSGRIAYTLLLRDDGTVLNDATVWRLDRDRFWIFTGRRADFAWIAELGRKFGATVAETSGSQAIIAVQGDISRWTIERALPGMDLAALPYYGFREARFAETDCWIARLGYSGEMGYEIVIADAAAPSLWEALLAGGANAGLVECGFDAADSLRIEAGHILFTRELVSSVTPFELGLGRLVDFAGRDFVGAQALRPRRFGAPARRLVGLMSGGESRAPSAVAGEMEPASALPAKLDEGMAVMTSTCFSPLLEQRIGIGFAAAAESAPGSMVDLVGGGRARVARLPFYDPPRALPRRGRRT